jgi:uncharacterized protein with FMN-binding domain
MQYRSTSNNVSGALQRPAFLILFFAAILGAPVFGQDEVEFLGGKKLAGKVIEIRKDAKEFEFEAQIGLQKLRKVYSYDDVHAVTFGGRRFELTPKSAAGQAHDLSNSDATSGDEPSHKSKVEVLALIEQAGSSPPDWLDTAPMNHPPSLELSWPLKANGPWDESKNVGQYLWGRVAPNPSRWRSGIKLVHHCMTLHEGDRQRLQRDMEKLGEMYFTLLQDYARAAYWLQKANSRVDKSTGVYLAECYWRLGSKELALAKLRGSTVHWDAIKLLGDMSEIDKALKVTNDYARSNFFNEAFINAGDALRGAGRFDEAIAYYQRVLDTNRARNKEYLHRFRARASGAIEAIRLFDQTDVSRIADGTYTDRSTGYNGELQVQVQVSDSRITSVEVTKHSEKQFYAALTDTSEQIIAKQGVRDIDGTSGATITSQAIVHAAARALAQGAR